METRQFKLSTATPPMAVGLSILIEKTTTRHEGSIDTADTLPSHDLHSFPKSPSLPAPVSFSSFLLSCHLCRKELRPDKDIYMYRGDLGFCSVQCRERQMVVDDMKKTVASQRHCGCSDGRQSEIRLLQRNSGDGVIKSSAGKTRPVFL